MVGKLIGDGGMNSVLHGMQRDRPEGPQQISPGQGYASYTSVAAALGPRLSVCVALKGRNNLECWLFRPFRAEAILIPQSQGGAAAVAASLCPGLIC
jgi:hypothetical protein